MEIKVFFWVYIESLVLEKYQTMENQYFEAEGAEGRFSPL